MRRGEFIVLEGIDGCGKTTQGLKLVNVLREMGVPSAYVATPRGGEVATNFTEVLAKLFLNGDKSKTQKAEMFIYASAHANISAEISRLLEKGVTVICDRYTMSTIAYQGYGLGINIDEVINVVNVASCGLIPSLTFILDINPMKAIKRTTSRMEQLHKYDTDLNLLVNVRKGFMEAAKLNSESKEVCILDGEKSEEELHLEILSQLFAFCPLIFADCWQKLEDALSRGAQ